MFLNILTPDSCFRKIIQSNSTDLKSQSTKDTLYNINFIVKLKNFALCSRGTITLAEASIMDGILSHH